MRFRIPGLRPAGVAALAALTAGTAAVAFTPGVAFAASPPTGTITALSQPTIVAGKTGQPAGNWAISVAANSYAAGDRIVVQVADHDGVNCSNANDVLAFASAPTVTNTTTPATTPAATFTSALASSPACAAQAGSPKDQLVITFTNGSDTGAAQTLTVSGVSYNAGTGVTGGAVVVNANGCSAADAACAAPGTISPTGATGASNATITLVTSSANNPPTGIKPATANQPISNVVITEAQTGAIPNGSFVCVSIASPSGSGAPSFSSSSTPTVTTGGNGATVNNGNGGPTGNSSGTTFGQNGTVPATSTPYNDVVFQVNTASSTAPSSYTLSGLQLTTGTATGPVLFNIGSSTTSAAAACGASNIGANVLATSIVSVSRIFGADRYGTAAAMFSGFNCNNTVVLSRGDLYPDALAASYLSGALRTGILLSNPNQLPDVTLAALRQAGVSDVFITGQTVAISQAVQNQLAATPQYNCGGGTQRLDANGNPQMIHVTRIGGATRYDTAQLIAQYPATAQIGTADLDGDNVPNPLRTAIVASGANFPDALSAGPMAYAGSNAPSYANNCFSSNVVATCGDSTTTWGTGTSSGNNGFPLLLTAPDALSGQAQSGLLNDGIQQVILMGGPLAVSTATESAISGLGIKVIRVGGVDRTDTAAKAAALETNTFSDQPTTAGGSCASGAAAPNTSCTMPIGLFYRTDHANLARGDDFADALSGGPHAAAVDFAAPNCASSGVLFIAETFNCFDGPTPILLTLDPNTLSTATHDYLASHSAAKVSTNAFGPTPRGGIVTLHVYGGPVAISDATLLAAQNALTGA